MTTTSALREPIFPKRILSDQFVFAIMVWAGFAAFMFGLTFVVSLVRGIEVSGWNIAGQPARWFAFVVGIYIGWTVLHLHVTHGGTRKGFAIQALIFSAAYSALLGALFALTFVIEAGYYGLMGWPQALHQPQLYAHPLDLGMVLIQWVMVFGVWTLGGLLIGVAWYRNAILGALCIPLGLVAVSISTYTFSGEIGPMNWLRAFVPPQPGAVPAIAAHLAILAVFAGLSWLTIRDMPIKTKSEAS